MCSVSPDKYQWHGKELYLCEQSRSEDICVGESGCPAESFRPSFPPKSSVFVSTPAFWYLTIFHTDPNLQTFLLFGLIRAIVPLKEGHLRFLWRIHSGSINMVSSLSFSIPCWWTYWCSIQISVTSTICPKIGWLCGTQWWRPSTSLSTVADSLCSRVSSAVQLWKPHLTSLYIRWSLIWWLQLTFMSKVLL